MEQAAWVKAGQLGGQRSESAQIAETIEKEIPSRVHHRQRWDLPSTVRAGWSEPTFTHEARTRGA